MNRTALRTTLAVVAAVGLSIPFAASAQPGPAPQTASKPAPGSQCFFSNQFEQWRDVDDKTIYIRVNLNEYYRLDMAASCPELTYPDPHLITEVHGPNTICSPLDWDLRVADGTGPGSFAAPCIVKAMTKLTKAEADAIPKKYKPN